MSMRAHEDADKQRQTKHARFSPKKKKNILEAFFGEGAMTYKARHVKAKKRKKKNARGQTYMHLNSAASTDVLITLRPPKRA